MKTRKVVKAIVVLTSVGVGVVIALFSCVTELLLPQYSVNNDIEVLAKEVAEIPLFVLSVASIFCFARYRLWKRRNRLAPAGKLTLALLLAVAIVSLAAEILFLGKVAALIQPVAKWMGLLVGMSYAMPFLLAHLAFPEDWCQVLPDGRGLILRRVLPLASVMLNLALLVACGTHAVWRFRVARNACASGFWASNEVVKAYADIGMKLAYTGGNSQLFVRNRPDSPMLFHYGGICGTNTLRIAAQPGDECGNGRRYAVSAPEISLRASGGSDCIVRLHYNDSCNAICTGGVVGVWSSYNADAQSDENME